MVLSGLTSGQQAEVDAAVASGLHSATGAGLHIAIRDAEIAGGAVVAEAERSATAMVSALHQAEKAGPEAVEFVMGKIQDILGTQEASEEATTAMTQDFDAFVVGVTAEQMPVLTAKMSEAFNKAKEDGGEFVRFVVQEIGRLGGDDVDIPLTNMRIMFKDTTGAIEGYFRQMATNANRHIDSIRSAPSSDVFRPSQIDPNRAGGSQPAIQVTAIVPRDAVTDAMLQNAPPRQALHGTA